jgi:hypothetical protein
LLLLSRLLFTVWLQTGARIVPTLAPVLEFAALALALDLVVVAPFVLVRREAWLDEHGRTPSTDS